MSPLDNPQFRQLALWWFKNGWASIGFAGTPQGMTGGQMRELRAIVRATACTVGLVEFHHGDGLGADVEAHSIALELGCRVIVHPPNVPLIRANLKGHERKPAWAPFLRTKDLVFFSHLLIAAPALGAESANVDSWMILRMARGMKKATVTLAP